MEYVEISLPKHVVEELAVFLDEEDVFDDVVSALFKAVPVEMNKNFTKGKMPGPGGSILPADYAVLFAKVGSRQGVLNPVDLLENGTMIGTAVSAGSWVRLSKQGYGRNGDPQFWVDENRSGTGQYPIELGVWHPRSGTWCPTAEDAADLIADGVILPAVRA